MAYYRNRETGKVQFHPKSGLGATFNAEEIGEDGKPVKPRTSLAPSKEELKTARDLLKNKGASPIEVAAAEALLASAPKDSGSKNDSGSADKQEGDQ